MNISLQRFLFYCIVLKITHGMLRIDFSNWLIGNLLHTDLRCRKLFDTVVDAAKSNSFAYTQLVIC